MDLLNAVKRFPPASVVLELLTRMSRKRYFACTLAFLGIASIAGFLRFWGLGDLPFALYRDETWNGVEGLITIRDMDFRPFYLGSSGREGLLIWLIGIVHAFLEPSPMALRLAPALLGFVTVLAIPFAVYFLFRFFYETLLGRKPDPDHDRWIISLSLCCMFFLATSYWHVNFSRITFRAILDPLFTTLACTFTALAYQYPKKFGLAILAGITAGLGLYGYGTFKFTIFPLAFIFVFSAVHFRSRIILPTLTIAIVALLVAYPLLHYIYHHADHYFVRLKQVSIFKKDDPWPWFWDGLSKLIGMLGGEGDRNLRHNTNRNAQLGIVNYLFFLLGLFYLIRAGAADKDVFPGGKPAKVFGVFAILWLAVMLAPAALTYDIQPHSLRAIGTIVPIMMLSGLGAAFFFETLRTHLPQDRKGELLAALVLVILVVASDTANEYFVRYQRHPGMKTWFDIEVNEAMRDINKTDDPVLIIVEDSHDPETHARIQTFRYLSNLRIDHRLHNNIIRLRDLENHPLKDSALVYATPETQASTETIVGEKSRVRLY